MCITPEKNGVRLQTVVGRRQGHQRDASSPTASSRPIADAECKGTERAEWSKDGQRVFRSTDVTCGKEAGAHGQEHGVPGAGAVVDQRAARSRRRPNDSVRVQRYRRAINQKLADGSSAPQPDANTAMRTTPDQTRWSVEDVIEASSKVPAEARAGRALTRSAARFNSTRRHWSRSIEGGVTSSVIDLMVALAYPQRFVVERRGGSCAPTGISIGGAGSIRSCPSLVGSR